MIKSPAPWILLLLALPVLAFAPSAVAQQEEDEKLEDYAEQDRKYLERYQKKEGQGEALSPEEAEAEMFARVEALIRDRNYAAASSDTARVQTDDPRVDPEAVARLMDSFRSYFESFWADRLELAPYDKPSRVFLFYSFYKYNQLLQGDFRLQTQRPKGHYGSMFDAITLHTDSDSPGDLPDTVVHEAAHQLVDQRLNVTVSDTQPWLSEGLATYFGNMYRDKDGTFVPDAVGGKSAALFRDGKTYPSRLPGAALRSFRGALKDVDSGDSLYGTLLWLRDPGAFYGYRAELNYNASWLLVHYLFHGADGARADAFIRFLQLERKGQGGPDALLKELGLTLQALDAEVARHAAQIKVR